MLEEDEPGAEDFPDIPVERPNSLGERYFIIRRLPMAPYMGRPGRTLPQTLESADAPDWLQEYYPHIDAYTGPPKTLSELQTDALTSLPGYDVHHIVEKGPALADGFSAHW